MNLCVKKQTNVLIQLCVILLVLLLVIALLHSVREHFMASTWKMMVDEPFSSSSKYIPITEKTVREEIQIIKSWLNLPDLHCKDNTSYPSPSNKSYPKSSFCKPVTGISGALLTGKNRNKVETCLTKSFPTAFGIQCAIQHAKNNVHSTAANGGV